MRTWPWDTLLLVPLTPGTARFQATISPTQATPPLQATSLKLCGSPQPRLVVVSRPVVTNGATTLSALTVLPVTSSASLTPMSWLSND